MTVAAPGFIILVGGAEPSILIDGSGPLGGAKPEHQRHEDRGAKGAETETPKALRGGEWDGVSPSRAD